MLVTYLYYTYSHESEHDIVDSLNQRLRRNYRSFRTLVK